MSMMLYITPYTTRPGESLRSIAEKICGPGNPKLNDYINSLIEDNQSFMFRGELVGVPQIYPGMNINTRLPSYTSINLGNVHYCQHKDSTHRAHKEFIKQKQTAQRINKYINQREAARRANVIQLADNGFDHSWVNAILQLNQTISWATVGSTASTMGLMFVESYSDHMKERYAELGKRMKELQQKLIAYSKSSVAERAASKQEIKSLYDDVMKNYVAELIQIKLNKSTANKAPILTSRSKLLRNAHKGKFTRGLISPEETKQLMSHINKLKWLGRGAFATEIVLDAGGVVETYERGGDWVREIGKMTAGIAGAVFVSQLAGELLLAFDIEGMACVIIVSTITIGADKLFESGYDKFANEFQHF